MAADPRVDLVEICHLIAARGYTTATGGNVSVRMPDGTFWVTPGGLNKARVRIEDLVRISATGEVLEGTRKPSSETFMHLAAYQALPQAGAVVHAHPPYASGFSQAGKTLDTSSSSEAVAILGRDVPLIAYAHPGSNELAELIGRAMKPTHKAYMMKHHGVITWGTNLWDAYDILDVMELYAHSLVASIIVGNPLSLPEHDLQWLEQKHLELMKCL
ncbi:MAG: class II aldolase/adducin family protein [Armatimonadota bacterium]